MAAEHPLIRAVNEATLETMTGGFTDAAHTARLAARCKAVAKAAHALALSVQAAGRRAQSPTQLDPDSATQSAAALMAALAGLIPPAGAEAAADWVEGMLAAGKMVINCLQYAMACAGASADDKTALTARWHSQGECTLLPQAACAAAHRGAGCPAAAAQLPPPGCPPARPA
jgi:hypothetical protein